MYDQFVVLRYATAEGMFEATRCYYTLYSSVVRVAHTLDTTFLRAPLIHFCGLCTMYDQFVVLRYETAEREGFEALRCYYTLFGSVVRVAHFGHYFPARTAYSFLRSLHHVRPIRRTTVRDSREGGG